jgi:membrane protease YdiL (CAAX protease family)
MTTPAIASHPVAPAGASRPAAAVAVMAALLGVFVARPQLVGTWPLMGLFAVLLAVGLAWPIARDTSQGAVAVAVALVVGVGAFALGRVVGGGRSPVPFRAGYVTAVTLAAVAEEAFFRRFVYAVLRPGGAPLAVAGSTVLFAVAHVTVYGWWVLPLDLAAGLVLSWQRWASGSWAVPAATHVVANLLVVL